MRVHVLSRAEEGVQVWEAWELEAPVDSCHVKVSKCKADVCSGPGWGARIYLGPKSACDLRFIAFFQIHPFYNDGGPFLLEDLRAGSLPKIVQRQVWGSFGRRLASASDQPPLLLLLSFYMNVDKGAEVNLMKRGCGYDWDRKRGAGRQWPMALVSVGVRLAPEVPLWCDCAEVALEPWGWGREGERGCVKFLFPGSPCKHETSSR